jgi:formamidopyrimidine-DNA glycosylase
LFVTTPDRLEEEVPELAHLGFDPLDQQMAWTRFGDLLAARKTKLKVLLMDQRFVAGIGNMYADEILFTAGLRHDRNSDSLTPQEVRRLYRSLIETLQEAIKHRGSSLADEQYRDIFGDVGEFQRLHNVYDREGEACPRCRSTIVRVKTNGRSSFLCPRCQI